MKKRMNKIMIRLIVYRAVSYAAIGIVLALLWNRFLNQNAYFSVVEYGFFVMGAVMLALAWVSYLRWDGLEFQFLNKEAWKKGREKKKHSRKDMVDFTEEEVESLDELEPRDKHMCRMCAFLLAGGILMIPALIAALI